jgi:hypothetical protein
MTELIFRQNATGGRTIVAPPGMGSLDQSASVTSSQTFLQIRLPNLQRRWWQVWKPRLIVRVVPLPTPDMTADAPVGALYWQADRQVMWEKMASGAWIPMNRGR